MLGARVAALEGAASAAAAVHSPQPPVNPRVAALSGDVLGLTVATSSPFSATGGLTPLATPERSAVRATARALGAELDALGGGGGGGGGGVMN